MMRCPRCGNWMTICDCKFTPQVMPPLRESKPQFEMVRDEEGRLRIRPTTPTPEETPA